VSRPSGLADGLARLPLPWLLTMFSSIAVDVGGVQVAPLLWFAPPALIWSVWRMRADAGDGLARVRWLVVCCAAGTVLWAVAVVGSLLGVIQLQAAGFVLGVFVGLGCFATAVGRRLAATGDRLLAVRWSRVGVVAWVAAGAAVLIGVVQVVERRRLGIGLTAAEPLPEDGLLWAVGAAATLTLALFGVIAIGGAFFATRATRRTLAVDATT
jgi:hypothetical protein